MIQNASAPKTAEAAEEKGSGTFCRNGPEGALHKRFLTPFPPAIVIGLDCITGLQTARILARHHVPVIAMARQRDHFCCRTRVCQRILHADTAGGELMDTLVSLGPELHAKGALFPCTDSSVRLVSYHREQLRPWYHVALPEHNVVEMLIDKVRFYQFAEQRGLATPKTFILESREGAKRAAAQLAFPCILKPPIKTEQWEQNTAAKVFKVFGADEFLALYDRCRSWADVLMVQEWIEGTDADLYSFNGYFDGHMQPVVTFIARKLRQWPPETGTSSLGVECRNDEVLRESLRLFQSVGYRGLGYVEMKRDRRTGKHYIIEPNIGRPTGRSAIAEAGGVELVFSAYCDMVGRELPSNREQTYQGVKWIYWRQDLRSAWHYWRKGELSLGQWWRSWQGRKACAVFSWSDSGPFWSDVLTMPRRVLGRLRKRGQEPFAGTARDQPTVGARFRTKGS